MSRVLSRLLEQADFDFLGCVLLGYQPLSRSSSTSKCEDCLEKSCHRRCLNQCWLQDKERQAGKRCLVACWQPDQQQPSPPALFWLTQIWHRSRSIALESIRG